jgi:hypothetical protein
MESYGEFPSWISMDYSMDFSMYSFIKLSIRGHVYFSSNPARPLLSKIIVLSGR